MIIKTINVRAVPIYVEKDKDDREMDAMDAERDLEMRMAVRY